MANNNYPEIDGLKIVHRESGWEDEWKRALIFLCNENPGLLLSICKKVLEKYALLWQKVPKDVLDDFRSFILQFWGVQYKIIPDKNGKFRSHMPKYDPQKGSFIVYLLGSITICHLGYQYIVDSSTIGYDHYLHKIEGIKRKGRKENKTKEEIQEEIDDFKNRIYYLSGMTYSDKTDEENNGNGSDVLENRPDSQNQRFLVIKNLVKQFIEHLNKKYLDNEYKEHDESNSITQVYRQAGAQLYPDLIESNLSDSPEAWTYSAQKQPVCNQKGIQCIIRKTLNIIKQNNPGQSPERTLYDIHYKAAQETDCKKDEKSEVAVDSYTKHPVVLRHFRPIEDIDDLMLLFGITSKNNAVKERCLYMQEIDTWMKKIKEQHKENTDCDK